MDRKQFKFKGLPLNKNLGVYIHLNINPHIVKWTLPTRHGRNMMFYIVQKAQRGV